MLSPLLPFDSIVTRFLADIIPHSPIFDSIFRILSAEGIYLVVWPVVAFIVFLFEFFEHKDRQRFLSKMIKISAVLFVTAAVTFGSVHYLLKPMSGRARPYVSQSLVAPYCPNDYSFPSGHAAVAWAGAYILIKFDSKRRREVAYCFIAAFVSYSRIYLNCHYFGDVLAGAIYGLLIGALCSAAYKKFFLADKQLTLLSKFQ